tara:strand:- start:2730 stop:3734 length:1005 start_codon:yes stop_codon:yes gene_type:complete
VSKLLNYFDLLYGCPRFDFLLQDDYILKYCKSTQPTFQILDNSPIIVFVGNDFNIYWEYRDGVMDVSPVESCVVLYKIIEAFGSKPFVYVKPSFSHSKCKNIVNLAKENNGVVMSCPKWSYMDFYRKFYTQRSELRKKNTFENKSIDTLFLGRLRIDTPTPRIVADYTDERYKYPIYRSQVDDLAHPPPESFSRQQTEIPGYPQRPWFLEKLRERIPVDQIEGLSADELPDVYLKSKIHFQPHGVGPRHSIYECMMLGIPSIIPDCSYLDDIVRQHNFICSELMHWIPTDDINNILNSREKYCETRDAIIDLYEANMTHTSIIDRVFKNIESII